MKKQRKPISISTKPLFAFRWQGPSGDLPSTDPTTTTVTITTSTATLTGFRR